MKETGDRVLLWSLNAPEGGVSIGDVFVEIGCVNLRAFNPTFPHDTSAKKILVALFEWIEEV